MIDRKPIIGVMGSHEKSWDELATPIGKLIAEHDYHLLTGAGGGVMTSVAKAFTSVPNRQGMSIGIVPTLEYDGDLVPRENYPNEYIEIPVITPLGVEVMKSVSPFSRNHVNIMSSNAVILLPGAHGTKNEASLCIQFKKTAIYFGPQEQFKSFPEKNIHTENIEEIKEFLAQVRKRFRTSMENNV